MAETYYPKEENLRRDCLFWNLAGSLACNFPKAEIEGRTSCGGYVDEVCLLLKDGREALAVSGDVQEALKMRPPDLEDKSYIPAENIIV